LICYRFSEIYIAISFFAIYLGCQAIFQQQQQQQQLNIEFVLKSLTLVVIYINTRVVDKPKAEYILYLFPIAAIIQLLYGIKMQAHEFAQGYSLNDITGVFYNSGIYGGFVALAIVVLFGLFIKRSEFGIKYLLVVKIFFILAFIVLLLQLFASQSRSAWLACFAGFVYLMGSHLNFRSKFLLYTRLQKALVWILVFSVITLLIAFLYGLKKDSANGRILIWKVSLEMIKEKPLFGHGIDSFQSEYMKYQGAYFYHHPNSPYSSLADDNALAFNEFLKILVEQGLVGLIFIFSIVYMLFFRYKKKLKNSNINIYLAALIAILVFGTFSYPLSNLRFQLIVVFFIASVSNNASEKHALRFNKNMPIVNSLVDLGSQLLNYKRQLKIAVVSGWLMISLLLLYWIQSYSLVYIQFNNGLGDNVNHAAYLNRLEVAFSRLKNDGVFLYNYGKALNLSEKYNKAIPILLKSNDYISSSATYIELGISYQAIGDFEKARSAYITASYMIPSRFTPNYLLAKMLFKRGSISEAKQIANQLLNKDIKIWNPKLHDMLDEMNDIKNY
jgi:O-antigen polymerase